MTDMDTRNALSSDAAAPCRRAVENAVDGPCRCPAAPVEGDGLPVHVLREGSGTEIRPTAARLVWLVEWIGRWTAMPKNRRMTVVPAAPLDSGAYITVWRENPAEDYCVTIGDSGDTGSGGRSVSQEEAVDTLLRWVGNLLDAPGETVAARMVPAPDDDVPRRARRYAERRLRRGRIPPDRLGRDLIEDMGHLLPPRVARRIVRETWETLLEAQRSTTGPTDNDRLDAAFEELRRRGFVARQDFGCCQRFALDEVGTNALEGARGLVFYHLRDTHDAIDGAGLRLSYAPIGSDGRNAAKVGHEVVAALEKAGLAVSWNGDPGERILVSPMNWCRRLRE